MNSRGKIKDDKNYTNWVKNNKPTLNKELFDYLESIKNPHFLRYCLIEEKLTGKNYFSKNANDDAIQTKDMLSW